MSYSQHYGERLAPLMKHIEDISAMDSTPNNQHMAILKKTLKIALEEKHWGAYLIAIYQILYFTGTSNINKEEGVKHCADFLRFYKKYINQALEQSYYESVAYFCIVSGFSHVVKIYSEYPQIDDEKLDSLFGMFHDAVKRFGYEEDYWEARMKFEILQKNKQGTAIALEQFFKYRSHGCYVCISRHIEKAYLLIGEIDKAIELFDDIIAGRIPNSQDESYENCENGQLHNHSRGLLMSSVILGLTDLFGKYASIMHDSLPLNENTDEIDLVASAFLRNFEYSESEMLFLNRFENKQMSPYRKMIDALCIWAYLNGIKGSDMQTIALCWEKPVFEGADSDECSVDSAIVYFEAIADGIGEKFDKSRKAFDYQDLKSTFRLLSNGH